jgi:hypothetical protein
MNIPPFLEKLLLSNEATFKVATLGLAGQNYIDVPKGKTAVILELSIEPFSNWLKDSPLIDLFKGGRIDYANYAEKILGRLMFQIQLINDSYSAYFSIKNNFSYNANSVINSDNNVNTFLNTGFNFTKWSEEVFIYIDRGIYLNFIYPVYPDDISNSGLNAVYTTPLSDFLPRLQNLPTSPVTFYKNSNADFVIAVTQQALSNPVYLPVDRNLVTTPGSYPISEYFQLSTDNPLFPPDVKFSIVQPAVSGNSISFYDLFTLPLVNVKYVLINKRASDYGLTFSGK